MSARLAVLAAVCACTAPAAGRAPAPRLEDETLALLRALTAVDTSHGGETRALRPIAEALEAAGVPVQILESAPSRGNLVARLAGTGARRPLLLVAHVDVVPTEGQPWTVPPFAPLDKDGFVWGRGVGDDKGMAAAFTAIVLELARARTRLGRDVILALTAGEEAGGFAGVKWLVDHHRALVDAEVALDEGGALITAPDFSRVQLVSITAAEKIDQSYRIVARGAGGHAARPRPGEDPALALARALVRVGELRFPARVLPVVKDWLAVAARDERAGVREALLRAARSAPALAPEDEAILSADATYAAFLHTTCVTTMLQAAPAENVLPTTAEATVNCRILPDETRAQTRAALVAAIADPTLTVEPLEDFGTGPVSPLDGPIVTTLRQVAAASFPGAQVVVHMQTSMTDSRYLRAAGIAAYGVTATPTSLDEVRTGHGSHGPDERRPARWLGPGARYLRDLVVALAR